MWNSLVLKDGKRGGGVTFSIKKKFVRSPNELHIDQKRFNFLFSLVQNLLNIDHLDILDGRLII